MVLIGCIIWKRQKFKLDLDIVDVLEQADGYVALQSKYGILIL